jgi:hypothetical protein
MAAERPASPAPMTWILLMLADVCLKTGHVRNWPRGGLQGSTLPNLQYRRRPRAIHHQVLLPHEGVTP